MSPRAACLLDRYGFQEVYDYVLGIEDWRAAGLPTEGEGSGAVTVMAALRPDVPTCQVGERVGEVRIRVRQAGWDECVVLACGALVVGRLGGPAWEGDDGVAVEEVMEMGPSTVRGHELLHPLVERMTSRHVPLVVVTDGGGNLLGVVRLADAERLVNGEPPQQVWRDCEGCPGRWYPGR